MAKDKKKLNNKNSTPKKQKSKPAKKPSALPEGVSALLAQVQTVGQQVSQLSTSQKVVGGVTLLAAGLTYWAKQRAREAAPTSAGPGAAPVPPSPAVDNEQHLAPTSPAAVTPQKKAKARKRAEAE